MMKPIQMLGVVGFAVGVVLSKTSVAVMRLGECAPVGADQYLQCHFLGHVTADLPPNPVQNPGWSALFGVSFPGIAVRRESTCGLNTSQIYAVRPQLHWEHHVGFAAK